MSNYFYFYYTMGDTVRFVIEVEKLSKKEKFVCANCKFRKIDGDCGIQYTDVLLEDGIDLFDCEKFNLNSIKLIEKYGDHDYIEIDDGNT